MLVALAYIYLLRVSRAVIEFPITMMEAASSPISFNKNCPGTTVMAGKPIAGSNTSGVLSIKESVVTNNPKDNIPPTIVSVRPSHLA